MDHQDIARLLMAAMILAGVLGLYFGTRRIWYVRFDRGHGHYDDDPIFISAHTFEGAKRKAKRMVARNNWDGFKLRTY